MNIKTFLVFFVLIFLLKACDFSISKEHIEIGKKVCENNGGVSRYISHMIIYPTIECNNGVIYQITNKDVLDKQ